MKKISFTLIDSVGKEHRIETQEHEYNSLMELIVNELYEEIGDCKGRAWCGTCIVKQLKGIPETELEKDETDLLSRYPNPENAPFRLSCQLEINDYLNNTSWEIVDSRVNW